MKKVLSDIVKNFFIAAERFCQFTQNRTYGRLPPVNPPVILCRLFIIGLRHTRVLMFGLAIEMIGRSFKIIKNAEMNKQMIGIHLIDKVSDDPIIRAINKIRYIAYI